ncbi:MAG: aryl-sulfate sulfotransferase [Deltaproteobacteria bacterium]|nr:aryl-sulfate sulfotransferase [Deltaproteobacteria bacterium]
MAWPYKYESGVTHYDRERAFRGYTLITPMPGRFAPEPNRVVGKVSLMNMEGEIVHYWTTPYPPFYARLMPDGHLVAVFRCSREHPNRPGFDEYHMGGATGLLMELDWEGRILFEHFDPNMHHDFRKLKNGNYMYVGWEVVPKELATKVRGGQKGTEHKDGTMFCDYFREIDSSGRTQWEWHGIEHFDPDIDIIGAIHPREEWTHINTVDVMPNGNIFSCSRHTDGAFIIDRNSGEIVWRWGNVAYLDKKTGQVEHRDIRDQKTMGGPHDAHLIEPGLPGEGNMLIYDNSMYRYISRAVEVDITTGDIVWQSEPDFGIEGYVNGRVHFSPFISGADRLPNGNTLICSGGNGVVFEVTKDRETVWHWVRPEPNLDGAVHWGIFRAHRYPPDYCPQFKELPPA